jgi:hypothetical protein
MSAAETGITERNGNMDFIARHMELIIIAAVVVFVVRAARVLLKARKIDREGIETDAVVSRVEEQWDPDTASSAYLTYVRYRGENGEFRESPMALTSSLSYEEGGQVRIRFVPGDDELVREVR